MQEAPCGNVRAENISLQLYKSTCVNKNSTDSDYIKCLTENMKMSIYVPSLYEESVAILIK